MHIPHIRRTMSREDVTKDGEEDDFFDDENSKMSGKVESDNGDGVFEKSNERSSPRLSLCLPSNMSLEHRIVFITAIYITLFAGAVYGWGPMQLMLEMEGAFADKCSSSPDSGGVAAMSEGELVGGVGGAETVICEEQTVSLLRIPWIASLVGVLSPVLGHVADTYGSDVLTHLLGAFGVSGISLVMVAAGTGTDWLYYLAFCLLYLVLMSGSIMITKTGLLFNSGDMRRRVISGLNALLDAGSLTYLILLKILEGIEGATFLGVVGGYLGLAVICFGTTSYLWARMCRQLETGVEGTVEEGANDESKATGPFLAQDQTPLPPRANDQSVDENECHCERDPESNYLIVRRRTPKKQLRSQLFLLLLTYFVINGMRNTFTLATAREFLGYLGDDETGNKYLSIFTYLNAASILGQPGIDVVLKRYGYGVGLQVVNVLGLIHGVIMVSSSNLNVQVVGFVMFSFYRGFLFSVVFSFLASFLSANVIGKGAGVMSAMYFAFSFVNMPMADWAVKGLGGDFFWPNFIYTIAIIPCVLMSCQMGRLGMRESVAEKYVCVNCQVKQDTTRRIKEEEGG